MVLLAHAFAASDGDASDGDGDAQRIPTGKRVTPLAAPGADLQRLNPGLKDFPDYLAGQAISSAMSPDRRTLLVLTSGYNRLNGPDGKVIPAASDEYVFVYSATGTRPALRQVLKVPNTFAGIAFSPDGKHFYVSGGVDDDVHFFSVDHSGSWSESGEPMKLNHKSGLGLTPGKEPLASAGIAVTSDGALVLIANTYNDSVSLIDAARRKLSAELDLRPGNGIAGGEYPFWIAIKGSSDAFVSSLRDREIVRLHISPKPTISARIKVKGNPNKMVLNRDGSRLFVACDNTDTVAVIDTRSNRVIETIDTTAPPGVFPEAQRLTGSGPNDLALADDERTLYVSDGGTNAVAVIQLAPPRSKVIGLIPTG
jgi:YVTN family beta-propeller protein